MSGQFRHQLRAGKASLCGLKAVSAHACSSWNFGRKHLSSFCLARPRTDRESRIAFPHHRTMLSSPALRHTSPCATPAYTTSSCSHIQLMPAQVLTCFVALGGLHLVLSRAISRVISLEDKIVFSSLSSPSVFVDRRVWSIYLFIVLYILFPI